jgi:hypothetical protein
MHLRGVFLQSIYVFDFLTTVSAQLKETLEKMEESLLDDQALRELSAFQDRSDSRQGVYVLHYDGAPVYLGKANKAIAGNQCAGWRRIFVSLQGATACA